MAANQALINSAYQAALGGTQAKGFGKKQTFGTFLGQVLPAVTQLATKYVTTRSQEFNSAAEKLVNNSTTGDMSDEDWNLRYDQAMERKSEYIFGNQRKRAEIMRDLDTMSTDQNNHDDTKANIVIAALGTNGINDNYKGTKQGFDMQGILNGDTPFITQ